MYMLKKASFALIIFFLPIVSYAADKNQLLRTKMLSDLDVIKNSFEVKYAPIEWKKQYAQWDLDEKVAQAKTQIAANKNITVKDYQRILRTFFNSTRDYHVNIMFYSTESAFLPFRIQSANGRYFIAWVDHRLTSVPIAEGDEIIAFDGKPIAAAVAEFKAREYGNGDSKTDQAKAEMSFTLRLGSMGMMVPKGVATISIKHAGQPNATNHRIEWVYEPEKISDTPLRTAAVMRRGAIPAALEEKSVEDAPVGLLQQAYFHKKMMPGFYEPWHQSLKACYSAAGSPESEPDPIGAKRSPIPDLGEVIWQGSDAVHFHAYLFKTPNQKIVGYVRIADFMGGQMSFEAAVREFTDLIKLFEERSDALVIDEIDNPGGDVFYMYALLSLLTDKPLQVPTHRVTLTQEDVYFAISSLEKFENQYAHAGEHSNTQNSEETVSGYPVTPELMAALKRNFNFIINEWNAGRTFSTPEYLYGIQTIAPHAKAHYSKPLLVLVNEMSLSCGDFFPAILQDNKRATIFGSRTGGAGGYILAQTHPNQLGIVVHTYTASIAERLDHKPVENLGVTPDIVYELTPEDLQNHYRGYAQAVQRALNQLLR